MSKSIIDIIRDIIKKDPDKMIVESIILAAFFLVVIVAFSVLKLTQGV